MRRMLITLMFSVVAINQGLFSVSHIQLMSRCAGARREHSQTKLSWPMEIFHTINIMLSLWLGSVLVNSSRTPGVVTFPQGEELPSRIPLKAASSASTVLELSLCFYIATRYLHQPEIRWCYEKEWWGYRVLQRDGIRLESPRSYKQKL